MVEGWSCDEELPALWASVMSGCSVVLVDVGAPLGLSDAVEAENIACESCV